eukprot:tig00001542_g9318.t1
MGDPAAAAGPPQVDVLTALQDQLDQFAMIMFTSIGVLQRDAPPAALGNEPCPFLPEGAPAPQQPPPPPTLDKQAVEKMAKEFAVDLVRASKRIDSLIDALPATSGKDAQLATLSALQREDEEVSKKVTQAVRGAEELLTGVKDSLRSISDDLLSS